MAETLDPKVLLDLYDRADRLRPLLEGASDLEGASHVDGMGGDRDSPFMGNGEDADQEASGEVRFPCDTLCEGGCVCRVLPLISLPPSLSLMPCYVYALDCFW